MEQGSLPERYLSRSVIKHIRRLNPSFRYRQQLETIMRICMEA